MSVDFYASRGTDEVWDGRPVVVTRQVPEGEELAFNVSNANAADLLSYLGLEPEYPGDLSGTFTADEVLGACLVATAIGAPDLGHEGGVDPRPGARMIHCGRREGYLEEKVAYLTELAQWAKANRADVTFA